ncbi:unnamed protein product [Tetraodon nigroviridis]|uniref:(spotted green pufferfish) hypothetical protein n=1 Tax=Tetraodon nigroviridis TaxID=99883 RepID=Q4T7G5_TETNG|nr:unnamed protein product [Tetraodon nigroviridis]
MEDFMTTNDEKWRLDWSPVLPVCGRKLEEPRRRHPEPGRTRPSSVPFQLRKVVGRISPTLVEFTQL